MARNKKWGIHKFSTGAYTGEDYMEFQEESKKDLRKQAKNHGLKLHTFSKNHYCFSAVLTDGENYVYVSQSDVRYSPKELDRILIRTMKHDKDWTGGRNQYTNWDNIGEYAARIIGTEK